MHRNMHQPQAQTNQQKPKKRGLNNMKHSIYYATALIICLYSCIQSNANASEIIATHHTDTPIYSNKTHITISTHIAYDNSDIASLGLEIKIPDNWKFISFSDSSLPLENNDGIYTTYWVNIPAGVNIQYDLEIHENESDIQSIAALVKYRKHGVDKPLDAHVLPNPLQLASSGYYITATAGSGGQIKPSGTILVAANHAQAFTIQGETGYTINTLSVDNQLVFATSHLVFDSVTDNHIIDVSFKKEQYELLIETTDGGTASPSGLLNVAYGTMQQIIIMPENGFAIESVNVNDEAISLTNNELYLHVISDMHINIAFRNNQLIPTHYCELSAYEPDIPLVIQSRIENPYNQNISALSMRVSIPFQWSFISANGAFPPHEKKMTDNIINFVWISGITDDVNFTYILQPPAISSGQKNITSEIIYRFSDGAEITTPLSPDITLTPKIDTNSKTVQGVVYLGGNPAPYTAQVNVSLMYLDENNTIAAIETKSDGPDYMLHFIDPDIDSFTILATYEGYAETTYVFSQIPEIQDIYMVKASYQPIEITEITENDSSATTVYEKELPAVQIGNTLFVTEQKLEAQSKDNSILAKIDIETACLKQITTYPAVISYTMREGISSTSSYVSQSNGNLLEINITNAEIDQQKGIRLSIPLQSNLSILDFQGDNPLYAIFHASEKSDLFDGINIVSVPPEDIIEIKDQQISFIVRSLSIFGVGDMPYEINDADQISTADSGGGCFIETCRE